VFINYFLAFINSFLVPTVFILSSVLSIIILQCSFSALFYPSSSYSVHSQLCFIHHHPTMFIRNSVLSIIISVHSQPEDPSQSIIILQCSFAALFYPPTVFIRSSVLSIIILQNSFAALFFILFENSFRKIKNLT